MQMVSALKAFLVGVAVTGGVLACAPIASADDPAACDPQGAPSNEAQPCEQQQQPGMPDLPNNRNSNNNNASPQQPQQAPQPSPPQKPQQSGVDLSDKDCWIINGVPVIYKPGTLATGPGDVVQWCPTTYGLQPH